MIKPQAYETEVIDKLFLELSQVTRATTGKELRLTERLAEVSARAEKAEQERDEALERLKKALGSECHGYMVDAPGEPLNMKFELACVKFKKELEKAEQENARLREALAELVRLDDQYRPDPAPHEWAKAWAAARTALGGE